MTVFFERTSGETIDLGKGDTWKECKEIIQSFLDEHEFKAPYWRVTLYREDHRLWIDVGSWSEFFHVFDVPDEDFDHEDIFQ